MKTAPWLLLLESLAIAELAQAATPTGAAFLDIDTSARATALGGAATASSDDVTSLRYNPAGLSGLKKREVAATHAQWLLDSSFDFIGYGQPTSQGTWAVGLTRLGIGGFEGRDASRQKTGSFKASDMAYQVGYGHRGLGASLKFIDSRIAADQTSTFALDLGMQQRLKDKIDVGISLLNIGPGLKFIDQTDPLPLTVAAGARYQPVKSLSLSLDLKRNLPAQRSRVGLGAEYEVLTGLKLRAGYASSSGADSALGGLSAGLGLSFSRYGLDYAFTPFGQLGDVQRFSLAARF